MAYCTITDIEAEYGEENVKGWLGLELDDTYDEVITSFINNAISYADRRIDIALNGKYVTPFTGNSYTAIAGLLREWSVDIAAMRIYTRRSVSKSRAGNEDGMGERFKSVIDDLKEIGDTDSNWELPAAVARQSQVSYGNAGIDASTQSCDDNRAFKPGEILT